MKIAVINFSGNVGKTTIARQLLAPRMKAQSFAVESLNASTSDEGKDTARLKGKQFGDLQEQLLLTDSVIVDIGASNVESFMHGMKQFNGSHEDFDYFIVPVVKERKQQADTINTIKTLASLGVAPEKIRLVFNKVETDDADSLESDFATIFGFWEAEKLFSLNPAAVLHLNEVYERLRSLKKDISEVVADKTDYRAALRSATNDNEKQSAVSMIAATRLAASAKQNLDDVYTALFAKG